MLIQCPRRPGVAISHTECPAIIMALPTSADLAQCLECQHGKALAALSPFQPHPVAPVKPNPVPVVVEAVEAQPEPVEIVEAQPEPVEVVELPPVEAEIAKPEPETKKPARKKASTSSKRERRGAPTPTPAPVRTDQDEIESLRNTLAYLLPKKHSTLGVRFVAMVAGRYGFTADVAEIAQKAGLKVEKAKGVFKIVQNKALRDFVKEFDAQ